TASSAFILMVSSVSMIQPVSSMPGLTSSTTTTPTVSFLSWTMKWVLIAPPARSLCVAGTWDRRTCFVNGIVSYIRPKSDAAGESPVSTVESPDFRPLYAQVKELLIARLVRGEWRPGGVLPSEFSLAATFGVSQGTVRKALDEMAAQNLVVRRQGRGTFVAQ